ncbi:type VI secretion system tube protein Hcp [Escherichia coli O88:H1]|nr:type VI secretion system tube protein Hcp [Escherichia coli O88:H1]
MGDIIYLRITGEQQGDISAGCGTQASVGNRYQQGHEDEIFVFSFQGGVSNTGFGINHQAIQFCKILDKSSPLLMNCINNNERCRFEFYFYRINKYGKWERYYYIEVRGATLTQNQIIIKENELDYQYITIHYEYIYCKHLTANTEFSYLLTPENYNRLFPPTLLPVEEKPEIPPEREIILTIGVFFDGTGNNLTNTNLRMSFCQPETYGLDVQDLASFNKQCMSKQGKKGSGVQSYLNYYTNIHWLNELYHRQLVLDDDVFNIQEKIYIEGIGTENNKADSLVGMGLGNNDTGVIAKTDRAISLLRETLAEIIVDLKDAKLVIKRLQFDVFGFSRGAAAARHFTNRVFERDPVLIKTIATAFQSVEYLGKPSGEVQFLGIFDTVAAIGGLMDGFDPHDGNNFPVKVKLPPGVAKHVFQLTAMNECRYNFCLNSIKESWPELSFPGSHADIGGGYDPQEDEYLFLSRPAIETVLGNVPVEATSAYQKAVQQAELLWRHSTLAPILPSGVLKIESNIDEIASPDHLGNVRKRVAAAVTFRRTITNDWSKIALRVMYEVAKEAGVVFDEIPDNDYYKYPEELSKICDKSISQAKDSLKKSTPQPFSSEELLVAGKYLHCSSNWNTVDYRLKNKVSAEVSAFKTFSFVNRPDENWTRTIYDMQGNKQNGI